VLEAYPRGRVVGDGRTCCAAASASARSRTRSRPCCSGRRSRTRACSRCSTRSSTTCLARSTCRRSPGLDPKTDAEIERPATLEAPFSALAFKVMSDPYVGKLTYFRVYSGKIKAGDRVMNTTTGKDRADRPHPADAREPPRGARGDRRGRDRGPGVGLKLTTTGDTLAAEERADRARVDDLPGPGDLGRRRAEVEGRPGQARQRAWRASPTRTPRSVSPPDEETGPGR